MATSSTILSRICEAEARYSDDVLSRHLALRTAQEFSEEKLDAIRQKLSAEFPPAELNIHVLATAGSLARMEAAAVSDLDIIMTTSTDDNLETGDANVVIEWRNNFCDSIKIGRPNPEGVFFQPIGRPLVEGMSGAAKESYDSVAKRVLFLLESQWLYNQDNYNELISAIIGTYARDVKDDPRKNFVFLLNDVIRYFRAICVNYQFTTSETADGKWPIRNIKLRHSRVLMYFSMVAAIGALSREQDEQKILALEKFVKMPPLKRLYVVYNLADDGAFYKVAGFYNTFVKLLSMSKTREELRGLEHPDRYESNVFAQLKANSDALSSELLRFYEARRRVWDDRFFEYMLL